MRISRPLHRQLLVLAFALTLGLAACGADESDAELSAAETTESSEANGSSDSNEPNDSNESNEETPMPTDDTDDTDEVAEPPSSTSDSDYTPIVPRTDLVALAPGVVDEIVADPDNDRQLLLRFEGAAEPCSGAALDVIESDTSVIVDFQVGLDPNAAAMSCIAQVFDYEMVIPLAAPLGDRTINIAG